VYTGNESLWFTGYLINFKAADSEAFSTLFVSLSDPIGKKTILSTRCVMEDGFSGGVLQLPDSIPAGEYSLTAYTDHLFKHPEDGVFQTWISVRYNHSPPIPYFNHPEDSPIRTPPSGPTITVSPDSPVYHQRSLSRWKVHLTDASGRPAKGIFSVSCVRKSRLQNHNSDILDYAQSCFIVRGLIKDTLSPFTIHIGFGNKNHLKAAASLLIARSNAFDLIRTEKDGYLPVSPAFFKGPYGTSIILTVAEKKDQDLYNLTIEENDERINRNLATYRWPLQVLARPEEVFSPKEKEIDEKALPRVVVKGRVRPDFMHPEYYQLPVMDGPCAAWICSCGHWKCLACPPARNPVKGCTYEDQNTGMFVKYTGCPLDTVIKPFIKRIKAINYPRAFQSPNFGKDHPEGMYFNTTLYWNYLIATDKDGNASFEFYTNDLSGPFNCTIQGVSTAGLISARSEITVVDE